VKVAKKGEEIAVIIFRNIYFRVVEDHDLSGIFKIITKKKCLSNE
jgi:hypothetical protein